MLKMSLDSFGRKEFPIRNIPGLWGGGGQLLAGRLPGGETIGSGTRAHISRSGNPIVVGVWRASPCPLTDPPSL